ncbi:MAG: tRNA1(Val) (adenine(37)-N6)-methyltransferase [Intestinibacillus sp.]
MEPRALTVTGGMTLMQTKNVFPLGQDSVLLGHFAQPSPRGRALDLGAGAGVLSLILLARFPALHVTALEVDESAAALCDRNRRENRLEDRMAVVCGDLRDRAALPPHGSMDYVVCNPPYFSPGSGSHHATLPGARQELSCTAANAAAAAAFALREGGKCAMVYRPERLPALLRAFEDARLTPKRLRFVHGRADKAPSAVLLEGMKGAREGLQVLPSLVVCHADGSYTDEYKTIYSINC